MLRIATFNVWFDAKLQRARTASLIQVIRLMQFDIICLQEVIPSVAKELVLGLPGWSCSDNGDGSSVNPYGVMALAAPGLDVVFSFHELPTNMARQLLITQHRGLAVGTVHLESLANHPIREAQLQECVKILAPHGNALLVGDFNFDSQQNFSPPHEPLENEALSQIMPQFVDLWPSLRPEERGLTFDSGVNPYIGKSEHMRYDRIMTRLSSWRPIDIDMFGHEAMDHLVQLSPSEQECAERPPTPTRPRPQPRVNPWELQNFQLPSEGDVSSQAAHAQTPSQAGAVTREQTPPQQRSKFFLSDHFGLIATFDPISV